MYYYILTEECPDLKNLEALFYFSDISISKEDFLTIEYVEKNKYKIEKLNIEIYITKRMSMNAYVDYQLLISQNYYNNLTDILKNAERIHFMESTKTKPNDSGNSGPYQRFTKFIDYFLSNFKEYKYNSIFYENNFTYSIKNNTTKRSLLMAKLLNINILIKNDKIIKKYDYYEDKDKESVIENFKKSFKKNINKNSKNISYLVYKEEEEFYIHCKLLKNGRLSHDPSIGFCTCVLYIIRYIINYTGNIHIINHGLTNKILKDTKNKFIKTILRIKDVKIKFQNCEDITTKCHKEDEYYSKMEENGEKLVGIYNTIQLYKQDNLHIIFSNIAGCEKTDIILPNNISFKSTKSKGYCDRILYDTTKKKMYVIEDEPYSTLNKGIKQIKDLCFYKSVKEILLKYNYEIIDTIFILNLYGTKKTNKECLEIANDIYEKHNIFVYQWLKQDNTIFINDSIN